MAVAEAEKASKVSSHVSDAVLRPFLQPKFDPADYLNSILPALSLGSQNTASRTAPTTSNANLADLSSHTQTLLSQLNAQTSRLTIVLTQLTDDIIRSGSRLAYEVDVLQGESLGLSEVVNDSLQKEISLFANITPSHDSEKADTDVDQQPAEEEQAQPQYISQLHMLTKVRERLDNVIKIFGEGMHWTLPPSEVSITSSFISVSGPEPGADSQSREQKGKEFAERLRTEIADLIVKADDPKVGLAAAQTRIDALRDLAQVWKGTAEEKARIRFVESLTKLAEDRLRELERGDRFASSRTGSHRKDTGAAHGNRVERGTGFLDNLHRLRNAG